MPQYKDSAEMDAHFSGIVRRARAVLPDEDPVRAAAFGLLCVERLAPCHRAFALITGVVDHGALLRAVERLWAHLTDPRATLGREELIKLNATTQQALFGESTEDEPSGPIQYGDYGYVLSDAAEKCVISLLYVFDYLINHNGKSLDHCPYNLLEATHIYLGFVTASEADYNTIPERYLHIASWLSESALFKQECAFVDGIAKLLDGSGPLAPQFVAELRQITQRGGIDPFGRNLLRSR
jgi:hypothetical protein